MINSKEALKYGEGYCSGYEDCKNDLKEIIESMAYEIFMYRNPKSYFCPEEEKLSIMKEFGWK